MFINSYIFINFVLFSSGKTKFSMASCCFIFVSGLTFQCLRFTKLFLAARPVDFHHLQPKDRVETILTLWCCIKVTWSLLTCSLKKCYKINDAVVVIWTFHFYHYKYALSKGGFGGEGLCTTKTACHLLSTKEYAFIFFYT